MELPYKQSSIFYEDTGEGPAVVLLHGFLENLKMWEPVVNDLKSSNRVITIDLLGHGKSSCLGYVHSMEMMAKAVKAVLDHLGVKEASFIGHSMGGFVALAFLDLFPYVVPKILLVTSTPSADSKERIQNRERALEAVQQNVKSFVRISIENLFNPETKEEFRSALEAVKEEALHTSTQGIVAALEGMKIRKDRTTILRDFKGKKAILAGSHDSVIPHDHIQKVGKSAKTLVKSLNGGHMLHIENREEHNIFIENFVDN